VGPKYFDTMFDLWQTDETNCSGIFLELARKWRKWTDVGNKDDIWEAISTWRDTCYSRLEGAIQSELEAMKESTREQFKLFAEQDQAECRSEGSSKCLSFFRSNSMINKLRRVIGSPKDTDVDELRAAERFVSACKEMAASDSIKRTNYEESTPLSTEPYFPHIRFYDYCERLLDVESLAQDLNEYFRWQGNFKYFGEKLDQIEERSRSKAKPGKTAENVRERKRSVTEAAAQVVEWNLNRILSAYWDRMRKTEMESLKPESQLTALREECLGVLDQVDNLNWLHQHMYSLMDIERSDQQMLEIERYLRYSEACKQLGGVKDEEIIETDKKRRRGIFTTCSARGNAKERVPDALPDERSRLM
jgi:hypothetical protein